MLIIKTEHACPATDEEPERLVQGFYLVHPEFPLEVRHTRDGVVFEYTSAHDPEDKRALHLDARRDQVAYVMNESGKTIEVVRPYYNKPMQGPLGEPESDQNC